MPKDGRKIIDLTGRRINNFEVIGRSGEYYKNKRPLWLCKCDCGNTFKKPSKNLLYNRTIDCGCGLFKRRSAGKRKHGGYQNRIYRIWTSMKARCIYKSSHGYERYGGRGIKVCDEWLGSEGFQNFNSWAKNNGYTDQLTIDRINIDGNYEPNNCRWVNYKTQENHRCNNTLLNINGQIYTLSQLCEKEHLSRYLIKKKYKDCIIQQFTKGETKECSN